MRLGKAQTSLALLSAFTIFALPWQIYKQPIYYYSPNVSENRTFYYSIRQKNGLFISAVYQHIFCLCTACHFNL
ncbi:hypothetical protein SAMN05216357_102196 [Porphyromonadaceae bacterium KH3CP3RA]|nr:hypothetical protein SAMN05216357_102196 [Porphyromonadaceae bacterium KH3CP3RA]